MTPEELREAVARKLALETDGNDKWWTLYMRRADAAAINAWPGAIHNGHWLLFPHTKISLPTENSNVEV